MNAILFAEATDEAIIAFVAGSFIFSIILSLAFFAIGILAFIFWILMLVDVINRKNWKDDSEKTLWLVLVLLVGAIGAVAYYFAIKKPYDAKLKNPSNKKVSG